MSESAGGRVREEGVRPYDFRRPGKFSKEQMRSLLMVHENFARLVTSFFLGIVRAVVKTSNVQVEQTTFPEFIQALEDPTVVVVFSLPPLPGSSLLVISPSLVHPVIHRLFGGQDSDVNTDRSLTEIEIAVIQRVMAGLLNVLAESWDDLATVSPQLQGIETNPLFTSLAMLNEVCLGVQIDAELAEHRGKIRFCVPFLTLEPTLAKLSTGRWFGVSNPEAMEQQIGRLQRRMQHVEVPIVARLATSRLSAREVVELSTGDVIVLDGAHLNDLTVLINNQPKFKGLPGTHRGRLAVELTERLQEVESDG